MHLLSGNYLFSDQSGTPSNYFLALTVAFGILFVASALAYWRRAKLAPENPPLRRIIRQAAEAGMWTAGVGLFLALMRYVEFPYLDIPFLLLVLLLSMIGIVGYFVYELSERYPLASYQLEQSHLQRRFRPVSKAKAEPQKVRPKVRGKRRN